MFATGAGVMGAMDESALSLLFHRLNNQLGIILANAELLEAKATDGAHRARAAQVVAGALEAMIEPGPYCFGGNVAYEMARQLHLQGEHVALLALINCMPPNSSYNRIQFSSAFCAKFLKNLIYWGHYVLHLKRGRRWEFLRWKLRAVPWKPP